MSEERDRDFRERLKLVELQKKDKWKQSPTISWSTNSSSVIGYATGPSDPVRRYWFQRPKQDIRRSCRSAGSNGSFTGSSIAGRPTGCGRASIRSPMTGKLPSIGASGRSVSCEGAEQTVALPVAVGWIGDAFIDALADYVRGTIAASVSLSGDIGRNRITGGPADLAFRFDFLVEADIAPLREILQKKPNLTAASVADTPTNFSRLSFRPFWLDEDLKAITDAKVLSVFADPYDKGQGGPHGRDYNMNHERWEIVNKSYPAKSGRPSRERPQAAETVLRDIAIEELTKTKADQAARLAAVRIAQQESRIAHLCPPNTQRREGPIANRSGDRPGDRIGIRKPAIRLDAIGTVFVSNKYPFV